jgi:hypothetical protein
MMESKSLLVVSVVLASSCVARVFVCAVMETLFMSHPIKMEVITEEGAAGR